MAKVETGQQNQPLLFISHKHADAAIADVLRRWIENRAMGNVAVFQSSAVGVAPRIGAGLNEQLMTNLNDAQSVVLIYTTSDQNWSYCMWECGVALDPRKPDTKVIVFQCSDSVPEPFRDRVRVNVRDKVSVQNFASNFLTKSDFFPRLGTAIAPRLQAKSKTVLQAGQELFDSLQAVLPPLEEKPIEEWPAVGFMRLELSRDSISAIKAASADERQQVTAEQVSKNCIVREGDYVAAQVVGIADLRDGLRFQQALDAWRESSDGTSQDWSSEVTRQISLAACWRFPGVEWTLFRGANGNWYGPMVHWVRRIPSEGTMQFDVHFLPIPKSGIPAVEA